MGELIERSHALHLLRGALDQAGSGVGCTALVCGEAGIGKTALVTQLVRQQGAGRVLWGGCEALSSPRPLGPLYDMSGALGPGLQAMLGLEGQRSALFQALLHDLLTARTTTLIVVEDLHWADAATLDWIKFLARRIARVPALLVMTYRDDELGSRHPLRAVLGDLPADAVVRVPLLPLSEAGVAELAKQSCRTVVGLYAVTGGNPFFVTEVLRSDGLPATVRDAVQARAVRQPLAVRALLDLVAIVPGRIAVDIVDAILAPRAEDVATALASGLLTADGTSYAFRHELARLAIEQALSAPAASRLHAQMLACMARTVDGVAMTRLVHHAAGANDAAAVLKYAPLAAAQAVSHSAHREAAALYATALAHSGGLDPRSRAELLEHRAYLCYLTDQIEDAIAARLSALAIWRVLRDPVQEGRALRWLSRLYWFVGRNRDAEEYADQAVQVLECLPAGPELAWALSNRSQLHMLAGRTAHAVAWGTRAVALANELGDVEVLVHALNNVGTAWYDDGDPAGKPMLEQSLHLSCSNGYGEHVARAYANLVSMATKQRDYDGAQRMIQEGANYFSDRDLDAWSNYLVAWQARVDFELGHWDAAAREAGALVSRSSVAAVSRIPALAVLARLRALRGDPGAQVLLDEATTLALETGELQRMAPVATAQAEAAWLRNDGAQAHGMVLATYALAVQQSNARAVGELGFWCRRLGLAHLATPMAEQPYRLLFQGDWQAAARAWEHLGCPYERAMALLEGDEHAMREALTQLHALGASASVRRSREHLCDAGVRGLPRGPRAATTANAAGLTTRELQILILLAQGLSNAVIAHRLVRSAKTVDHHISAILRKLDVHSRADAATVARRMGLLTAG